SRPPVLPEPHPLPFFGSHVAPHHVPHAPPRRHLLRRALPRRPLRPHHDPPHPLGDLGHVPHHLPPQRRPRAVEHHFPQPARRVPQRRHVRVGAVELHAPQAGLRAAEAKPFRDLHRGPRDGPHAGVRHPRVDAHALEGEGGELGEVGEAVHGPAEVPELGDQGGGELAGGQAAPEVDVAQVRQVGEGAQGDPLRGAPHRDGEVQARHGGRQVGQPGNIGPRGRRVWVRGGGGRHERGGGGVGEDADALEPRGAGVPRELPRDRVLAGRKVQPQRQQPGETPPQHVGARPRPLGVRARRPPDGEVPHVPELVRPQRIAAKVQDGRVRRAAEVDREKQRRQPAAVRHPRAAAQVEQRAPPAPRREPPRHGREQLRRQNGFAGRFGGLGGLHRGDARDYK
ncbi:hypothetical protein DFJ74DRAFT_731688, partial [Hyaloraphidium curvatum]